MLLARASLLALLAAASAPGAEPPRHLAEVDAALDRGAYEEAVSLAERAVAGDPRCSGCWHWLGKAYGLKAKHSVILLQLPLARRCKAAFEKAVELDPANTAARLDLISYYVKAPGIAGGSVKRAAAQAAELARLVPARGHLAQALIRLEAHQLTEAEDELKKAFEADPGDWRVLSAYTAHLSGLKRYGEALRLCDVFLQQPAAAGEGTTRTDALSLQARLLELSAASGRTAP